MVKYLFVSLTVLFLNISFVLSQPNGRTNSSSQIVDEDIEIPPDLENNFDQLLVDWRTRMKDDSPSCNYDPNATYNYSDSDYINRIYNLPTQMELVYNQVVRSYIDMYAGRRKSGVPILLAKSQYYFPIIEKYLDQYQIPLELKYLPVIESAFNPTVVSRAGATGLWQFMIGTGRMYDLEINSLVDERRDPVKASEAAARYLKDLYNIYGDWNLVIAAYNCGPGNVNKAIKRSGGETDYWKIYSYLPRETRGYVPAFIAANYIMNYPEAHGICPKEYDFEFSVDTIRIADQISMEQISEVLKMPIEDLRQLNPQYKKDIIPGGNKEYILRLPSLKAIEFIANKDAIYRNKDQYLAHRKVVEPSEPVAVSSSENTSYSVSETKVRYKVRKGDNLSSIAGKHKITVTQLKKMNGLKSNKLRVGQVLTVGTKKRKVAKKTKTVSQPKKEVVQSPPTSKAIDEDNGETPANQLAEFFSQVKENSTETSNVSTTINAAEVSVEEDADTEQPARDDLYTQNTIYHKVRRSETLKQIALRYNVSEKEIKSWNKMRSSKLKTGQRLVIYLPPKL